MKHQNKNIVVVLPDGQEFFREITFCSACYQAADSAVHESGIKTKKSNPTKIQVKIYELVIKNFKLDRVTLGNCEVNIPTEPMTESEYNEELNTILNKLPAQFQNFVSSQAWEHGHSSGYEEVINLADDLTSKLLPAIEAYKKP